MEFPSCRDIFIDFLPSFVPYPTTFVFLISFVQFPTWLQTYSKLFQSVSCWLHIPFPSWLHTCSNLCHFVSYLATYKFNLFHSVPCWATYIFKSLLFYSLLGYNIFISSVPFPSWLNTSTNIFHSILPFGVLLFHIQIKVLCLFPTWLHKISSIPVFLFGFILSVLLSFSISHSVLFPLSIFIQPLVIS
jgi:hypothetical protein